MRTDPPRSRLASAQHPARGSLPGPLVGLLAAALTPGAGPELIAAGVKIYEYTPGFVHGKVFVSDDEKAVVGTINLDFRSLYLHFECAAYMYRNRVVEDILRDYEETLKKCRLVTDQDCRQFSRAGTRAGRLLRLIAPLM